MFCDYKGPIKKTMITKDVRKRSAIIIWFSSNTSNKRSKLVVCYKHFLKNEIRKGPTCDRVLQIHL